jgi:hypothetical protein
MFRLPSLVSISHGRDRALSLEIGLITSIKLPLSFSFKSLRLLSCRGFCVEIRDTVELLAPLAIFAASGHNHESPYARRCRIGARTVHA